MLQHSERALKSRRNPLYAACLASLLTTPAYADLFDALEEVYVTAQKTTQSTQDVGIAVSAFTGAAIDELGLDNPMDLAVVTPGLSTANAVGDSVPIFSIRGVGLDDFNANNNGGVGLYVDEVFVTSPIMMAFQMFDTERVEVLKGPQGTLYGRNATGGAINFISAKPTLETEGYATVDYSRFDRVEVTAAVGGPITDNLGGRVAINYIDQGEGYQADVITGKEYGKTDKWALRSILSWDVTDSVNTMFILKAGADESTPSSWQADDVGGIGGPGGVLDFLSVSTGGGLVPGTFPSIDYAVDSPGKPRDVVYGGTGFETGDLASLGLGAGDVHGPTEPQKDDEFYSFTATVTVDLDTMEFVSITAYDSYERDEMMAIDGSAAQINDNWFQSDIEAISQEFRLSSDNSDDYSWVVGASYSVDNVESKDGYAITHAIDLFVMTPASLGGFGLSYYETPTFLGSALGLPGALPVILFSESEQEAIAYGVFGQMEYFLNDEVTLIGGLRYSAEEREFEIETTDATGYLTADPITGLFGPGLPLATFPKDDEDETNVSGKVGVNWAPTDDLLVYASYATGFKSGIYYGGATTASNTYGYTEPEEVKAFEVGFKATMADGKVRLNGAVFDYDYTDKQIQVTLNDPLFGAIPALANAPESKVQGAELELWASPFEGMTIQLTGSYLDAEVEKGVTELRGIPLLAPAEKGDQLSLAPKTSYSALLRYDWNIGDLAAYAQVNYSIQDEKYGNVGIEQSAIDELKDLGARVAVGSDTWDLALWGRNLTDEDGVSFGYPNFIGNSSYSMQHPQTYGVSATLRW